MYRPLPNELTIKNSPIEGLGLFTNKDIKANTFIGVTHIRDEQFENKYIRTPLGGFYPTKASTNPSLQICSEKEKIAHLSVNRVAADFVSQKKNFPDFQKRVSALQEAEHSYNLFFNISEFGTGNLYRE